MGVQKNKYEYLPISKVAPLAGLPASAVRQLVDEGRVICKDHASARYIRWASLVEALGKDVARILRLREDRVPEEELTLERREALLREAGYLPVPVAQQAASMTKATIYRWIRDNAVDTLRVTNRYYVKWASLVEVLGECSNLIKLDADKVPELPERNKQLQPKGPRVKPGSPMAKELRRHGYISVREAANDVGLGEKIVRRWIAEERVDATRYGSSILVSKESLDTYLEEVG